MDVSSSKMDSVSIEKSNNVFLAMGQMLDILPLPSVLLATFFSPTLQSHPSLVYCHLIPIMMVGSITCCIVVPSCIWDAVRLKVEIHEPTNV